MAYVGRESGPSYMKVYAYMSTNQDRFNTPASPFHVTYQNDLLFFQGVTFIPTIASGWLRASSVLSVTDFDTERVQEVGFATEKPRKDRYNRREDWERYGSPLGLTVIAGPTPIEHLIEQQVVHPRYVGTVSDSGDDVHYKFVGHGQLDDFHGTAVRQFIPNPTLHHAFEGNNIQCTGSLDGFLTFQSTSAGPTSEGENGLVGFQTDACAWHRDTVQLLKAGGPVYDIGYWHYTYEFLEDHSVYSDGAGIFDTSYYFTMRYGTNPYITAKFFVHAKVTWGFREVYGVKTVYANNFPSRDAFWHRDESDTSLVSIDYPPQYPSTAAVMKPFGFTYFDSLMALTEPARIGSKYSESPFISYRKFGRDYINRRHSVYMDRVNSLMSEIRPSAFLAASDALNNHLEVLSANHIENLSQIKGLLEIFPDVRGLIALAAKAMSGDASAIKDLIDYVTDAVLRYRFAQKPTVDDAKEIAATDITKGVEQLLETKSYTSYGVFKYEFPTAENFIGDGKLVLETRAKIRLTADFSTLLANLLTLNSVGLLPTLSRIWEVLPFSFVIDWFTNMSERLQLIDSQALYLTLKTEWVLYSYKLTYFPSSEELGKWGLISPDLRDPFGISVYRREFSRFMPSLTDSKFDFLANTRGPDPVTVGALVWQLLT